MIHQVQIFLDGFGWQGEGGISAEIVGVCGNDKRRDYIVLFLLRSIFPRLSLEMLI